tara:strand:+ start:8277 stop:9383 length:1107 start_codon:yes stop_codon:yes gene_type:complete
MAFFGLRLIRKFGVKIHTKMTNTLESSLVQLGEWLRGELKGQGAGDEGLLAKAEMQNRWFTQESSKSAMHGCGNMLQPDVLSDWLGRYDWSPNPKREKKVGLVLAGNLPMVGWHDVMCVLMTGHTAVVKTSSSDTLLITAAIEAWQSFLPEDEQLKVEWVQGKMGDVDAVIATGSANTNRYFEHYFKDLPRVLRSQRTSVAILDGSETDEDIRALGQDIFQYFGMGCRSVTKLFLPLRFDLDRLFRVWVEWAELGNHNKYANNYDYHKAVWLLNQEPLIENGFVLLKEDPNFFSPVGSLFYSFYSDETALRDHLEQHAEQLQCVATKNPQLYEDHSVSAVKFGQTQSPLPWDYADGVDTISFLLGLYS